MLTRSGISAHAFLPCRHAKAHGRAQPKASGRTDHHEKLKLYTKICVNLGVDEDKVSQKQAEKKLVEYVQRKEAKLPADDPISCLLVEVTEYIINCWRVQVSRWWLFTICSMHTNTPFCPPPQNFVQVHPGVRDHRMVP